MRGEACFVCHAAREVTCMHAHQLRPLANTYKAEEWKERVWGNYMEKEQRTKDKGKEKDGKDKSEK